MPQWIKENTITLPRKQLVTYKNTPYYPVISGHVGRSYLSRVNDCYGKEICTLLTVD
jgi:hypothetical protein